MKNELGKLEDDVVVTEENAIDFLDGDEIENLMDFAPTYKAITGREFTSLDMYMIQMYNQLYHQVYMVR